MRGMKDSGIEWIDKIPLDWTVKPLKRMVKFGKGLSITKDNLIEQGVPVVSYGQIHSKTNNGTHLQDDLIRFVSETYLESNPLSLGKKGDIFFADTSEDYAGIGNAVLVDIDAPVFAGYHTVIVRPDNQSYSRYLAYLFLTDAWRSQIRSRASGIKVFSITQGLLKKTTVILPPAEKSVAITDYLDPKCGRIDAIIARQQEVIEKLKVYKLSVITEAVTKGLNPDVPMKDSGIDFIGSIPETWRICRLRNIGTLQNGISKGGEFFGHGFPFVSYGDVYRNFSLPMQVTGLIDSSDEERRNYSVESGDIFFTRTSETIEEVGFSSVCEETIPDATFAGFLIRVRPFTDDLVSGFAKYYFRSNHHRYYLVKQMNLVTRASLGQDLLKSMPVLVPPKDEQISIAAYLDKKCSAIESSIEYKQRVIERLTAYKKSLIYEVVTGKKEV